MAIRKTGKFLYYDIVNMILQEYNNMPYFSPMKSERELCERYGVSRPTIRKALDILSEQKKILKVPGKGSVYIGREVLVQNGGESKSQISFFNNAMTRGNYVKNKVLFQNVIDASHEISLRLNVGEGTKVFNLQRLRELDGDVCSLESSFISFGICSELVKVDFSETPLHNTLEKYGIHIASAKRIVEIVNADSFDSIHLGVAENEKIVAIQTTCFDSNGKIIEYVLAKTPTEKIRIEFNIENK